MTTLPYVLYPIGICDAYLELQIIGEFDPLLCNVTFFAFYHDVRSGPFATADDSRIILTYRGKMDPSMSWEQAFVPGFHICLLAVFPYFRSGDGWLNIRAYTACGVSGLGYGFVY